MIDSLIFTNLASETVELNTDTLPLRRFDVQAAMRRGSRPKMQTQGVWPSFSYLGEALITCEGDILHNTSEAYITERMEIMRKLLPDPSYVQSQRKLGTLELDYTGMTETMITDVTLDAYPSMPMEALSPSVTPYLIVFVSFNPYFIGTTTGTRYFV